MASHKLADVHYNYCNVDRKYNPIPIAHADCAVSPDFPGLETYLLIVIIIGRRHPDK